LERALDEEAIDFVRRCYRRHRPRLVVAMFSGGKDSLVATHIASRAMPRDSFVVGFIDTGLALRETKEYVSRACREMGWDLRVLKSKYDYEELVKRWGFPVGNYRWCMWALKIAALREFKKQVRGRILWVSGLRRGESARRMKLARLGRLKRIYMDSLGIFISPLFDWGPEEVERYISLHGLPRNERVWELLKFSGDCFCGCWKRPEEIFVLKEHFPEMFQRLLKIEREVNRVRRRSRPMTFLKRMSLEEIARQTSLAEFFESGCHWEVQHAIPPEAEMKHLRALVEAKKGIEGVLSG